MSTQLNDQLKVIQEKYSLSSGEFARLLHQVVVFYAIVGSFVVVALAAVLTVYISSICGLIVGVLLAVNLGRYVKSCLMTEQMIRESE